MMATEISNNQDVIDSRDVIARIEELTDLRDEAAGNVGAFDDVDQAELESLLALAEQGESTPDWNYGAQLIRDDYFEDYARQLAEDIGAIDPDAGWPCYHIDWAAAARSLQMDYTPVEFDGVTYWAR